MNQTKFIFTRQLVAIFTITAILLPSISSALPGIPNTVPFPIESAPTPTLIIPPANRPAPNADPNEIDPSHFLKPPPPPGGSASRDNLDKWRQTDQKFCEAEATGKKNPTLGQAAADALIKKPLKDAVNEQLGLKAIPDAVNQTINNTAAKAIEEELQIEIQNGIKEGLKEEIPKTLAEKLADARADGLTDADIQANRGLFRGLVRDSIRESLPRVLNEDFVGHHVSNAIDKGLRRSLQSNLRLNFGQIAKPTIETYYRAQIDLMLEQIPGMVKEKVDTIKTIIEGTKAGFEGIIQGAKDCATDPICLATRGITAVLTGDITQLFPEVKQMLTLIENLVAQLKGIEEFLAWLEEFTKPENQEKFVQAMVEGFALQLEQSLTAPKNIEKLADAITGAISGPINKSIKASIDNVLDSAVKPIEALENAIDSIDERIINQAADAIDLQLSMTVAQITKPATIIIDHIGDTLAIKIDETVGAALYPLAQGITGGANYVGGVIAGGINNVGYGIQDLVFGRPQMEMVPDDFVGPLAPNQMTETWFDVADTNGITVVPDSIATLRPGEMHFSDFQASLPSDAPLTGVMSSVASDAAQTTQDSAEQVTAEALNKTGVGAPITSDIARGFKAGMGQVFASTVGSIFEGIPYVGPILAQVVEQILTTAMAGAGMAPVAGGFPVMDVGVIWSTKGILSVNQGISKTSGKILTEEKQTKELTEKLLNLQIQSCTNLKVMRRIQLMAEEEMFIFTPNAHKANAAALAQNRRDVVNLVNQGRQLSELETGVADPNNENKGSLIVANLNNSMEEAGREARSVFQDKLAERENDPENYPYAKIVREALVAQENQDPLRGTLTKTEIDTFRDNPGPLSNEVYWNTLMALAEPVNNPLGQMLIAQGISAQETAIAENSIRDEYIAGSGYLGTRECIATSASGGCDEWRILTPGSTWGNYTGETFASTLRQAENLDEDFIKGEIALTTESLANLSNYSDTPSFSETNKSIFDGSDPCPGPGPCPQTGWNKISPSSEGGGSANNGGSGSLALSSSPNNLNLVSRSPSVIVSIKTPTIAEINAGQRTSNLAAIGLIQTPTPSVKNETIFNWSSSNADVCVAKNDWPSNRVGNNVKNAGVAVGKEGTITITHPINFRPIAPAFSQTVVGGIATPILTNIQIAGDKLRYQLTFNPVNGSGIHTGDIYQLALAPNLTLTIGPVGSEATATKVIDLFRTGIAVEIEKDTDLGQELAQYSFAYFTDPTKGTGSLIMSPKLIYQLACTRGEETVGKTITITRQP